MTDAIQTTHSLGRSAASTIWVGLDGRFTPHVVDERLTEGGDLYQLFVARSSAMGWLTDATRPVANRQWGMNDAGYGVNSEISQSLAFWFQVVLTESGVLDQLLPLQPLLACVGDVVARLGTIDLRAARIVLPVPRCFDSDPPSGMNPLGTLAHSADWFPKREPLARTHLDVTLDGGSSPKVAASASTIFEWTHEFVQEVFHCDGYSASTESPSGIPHGIVNESWFDPPNHRVTLSGTLTEWSLDALGWTSAFLAYACHRNGVRAPVLLTATRSSEADANPPAPTSLTP